MDSKKTIKKYEDKELPIEERKADYRERIDKMMNPIPEKDFNPDTFEPAGEDMRLVADRKRELPPTRLPLFGLKPKKMREGQMIGMFESKQDLYLTLAHRINQLQDEIDLLKNKNK